MFNSVLLEPQSVSICVENYTSISPIEAINNKPITRLKIRTLRSLLSIARIITPPNNQTDKHGTKITLKSKVIAHTSKTELLIGKLNAAKTPIDITHALGLAH